MAQTPVARSFANYLVAASLALSLATAPTVFAADKAKAITFDDLAFEMEKGGDFERSMLTPEIEALDGKRVSIKGYMLPSFQEDGIKNFVFVRDNLECCYGPGAALFDCTLVRMQGDATASFSIRPMTVEGIFRIDEYLGPDEKHLAIFRIDADKAK
ncbi:MAG TPA: hypothetical protein VGN57_14320 [Pirellulaceae bacterium]|jgi:hypothetical protein|nr:hypothetical protein [Pirellulaceae bacterium]